MRKKSANIPSDIRPTLFVILDGFGLSSTTTKENAITEESAPHIFGYMKAYPFAKLAAHGKDVGLFPDQAGNSEAGHLNIGAGRLVKQDIVEITEAIADGTFFKNEAFHQGVLHAQKYKSAVHLMGLLTDGQSAHAHPDHLYALLQYFRKKKIKNVFIHLFTDGRDASPHSAVEYLSLLRKKMKNGEKIATVSGRFYAMDRNKTWERTKQTYDALVQAKGFYANSAEEAILAAYNRKENDEYIQPTVIQEGQKPVASISDNDVVVFFNTRSDRARQLAKVFIQKDFNKKNPGSFRRTKKPHNVKFVALTDFGPDLDEALVAFPSPDIDNCLAKAVGESYRQLYISETEKYAHVTYFLNGGYPDPINGEKRELLSSAKRYSYVQFPQMRTAEITKKILEYTKKDLYNFVVVNFPNVDMVGHTGNMQAAKKAVQCADANVHKLVQYFLKKNGRVIITADHGNAEIMIHPKTGAAMTEHTTSKVPFIVIDEHLKSAKLKSGRLSDVAPTILAILGIKKPKEMTGRSLLH